MLKIYMTRAEKEKRIKDLKETIARLSVLKPHPVIESTIREHKEELAK